ncbi:ABC transporter permease [Gynurincola endophyticus]|uniref:ABC transporter permease n=1 Tax=Gynurincola endophyticus TaxID=2479004 RepID=UPI000F8DDA49|nr:DUF3526 domain-containing protein [Gynurincola endophyticus]
MKQIIINELKMLFRVRVLVYLTALFIITLIMVTWSGSAQTSQQQQQQQAAGEHVREQWESIDNMNPHSAAHYGSYVFKPVTSLSSIDEGINSITGNVLRLEGHMQNEIIYSEASQTLSVSKFGKLKPSLLLQYIIPLLLIFLAFASVSSEKETGRLKLLVLQGASLRSVIFSKAISVWMYGLLLLAVTVAGQMIINSQGIGKDSLIRITLLSLVYSAYYYIITLLSTWFSARLKTNTASLSSMLGLWLLWTIFLPRIWGNTTDKLYPLPSRQNFTAAMQEDRSQGLDGHNPSDKRSEEFKQQTLAKYKVTSLQDLPVNFDGLRMQADEEYGNAVWDKHFGNNYGLLQKQKKFYQLSGIINPFASLQSTGMALSGSDMHHHLDFLQQAENYRRTLIKTLNDQHAFGGSKTGERAQKENNQFYRSISQFEYKMPSWKLISIHYVTDFLLLAIWVLAITIIVFTTSKKIKLA